MCYRFALAALVTQEFHFGQSVGQFFLVGVGGAVVGLAVAYAMLRMLTWVGDRGREALLTLVTAFACYFAAESLHLSGVIATVAGGLYAGRALPQWASPETRVDAKALWNVVLLAVNALVFTLIGLQLPTVLKGIGDLRLQQLCVWALVLTVAVIVIRFVWMFPAAWLPRKLVPGLAKRDPMPSFGELVVLGWTGMRGIVSLAAALALPATLANGEPFVERPLIIFLAYAVTLLTLIVPTVTLPLLLKYFGICDHHARLGEEVRARMAMSEAATSIWSGCVRKAPIATRCSLMLRSVTRGRSIGCGRTSIRTRRACSI